MRDQVYLKVQQILSSYKEALRTQETQTGREVTCGGPGGSKGQAWSGVGKSQGSVAVNHRNHLCQTKDFMGKQGRDGSQGHHPREQESVDDSLRQYYMDEYS